MWKSIEEDTIAVMLNGTHLLTVLWESAWIVGQGESKHLSTDAITEEQAMGICSPPEFLPSCAIDGIQQFSSKASV